jgi:hypothetical protein
MASTASASGVHRQARLAYVGRDGQFSELASHGETKVQFLRLAGQSSVYVNRSEIGTETVLRSVGQMSGQSEPIKTKAAGESCSFDVFCRFSH